MTPPRPLPAAVPARVKRIEEFLHSRGDHGGLAIPAVATAHWWISYPFPIRHSRSGYLGFLDNRENRDA